MEDDSSGLFFPLHQFTNPWDSNEPNPVIVRIAHHPFMLNP